MSGDPLVFHLLARQLSPTARATVCSLLRYMLENWTGEAECECCGVRREIKGLEVCGGTAHVLNSDVPCGNRGLHWRRFDSDEERPPR